MGEIDRAGRRDALRARNAKAVFLRNLRTRGATAGDAQLSFLGDHARERALLDRIYARLQGGPDEVELTRPEEGLALAREWLRDRRGVVYCLISNVGILSGEASIFLEDFDAFGFLGDQEDIVFTGPDFDLGFACVEFHGKYHASEWRP